MTPPNTDPRWYDSFVETQAPSYITFLDPGPNREKMLESWRSKRPSEARNALAAFLRLCNRSQELDEVIGLLESDEEEKPTRLAVLLAGPLRNEDDLDEGTKIAAAILSPVSRAKLLHDSTMRALAVLSEKTEEIARLKLVTSRIRGWLTGLALLVAFVLALIVVSNSASVTISAYPDEGRVYAISYDVWPLGRTEREIRWMETPDYDYPAWMTKAPNGDWYPYLVESW